MEKKKLRKESINAVKNIIENGLSVAEFGYREDRYGIMECYLKRDAQMVADWTGIPVHYEIKNDRRSHDWDYHFPKANYGSLYILKMDIERKQEIRKELKEGKIPIRYRLRKGVMAVVVNIGRKVFPHRNWVFKIREGYIDPDVYRQVDAGESFSFMAF